jgi:hypothetical protein
VSLTIEEFMTTYASLINANQGTATNKGKTAAGATDKTKALQYLADHFAGEGEFQVGKNRIFLRTTSYEKLQVSMGSVVKHKMCRFQALARKHIARKRFQHMRTLAIVLQAKIRMFLKRRKYLKEMAATVAEKLQAKRTIEQRNQVHLRAFVCDVCAVYDAVGPHRDCKSRRHYSCRGATPTNAVLMIQQFRTLRRVDWQDYLVLTCVYAIRHVGDDQLRAARSGPARRLHRRGVQQGQGYADKAPGGLLHRQLVP